MRRAKLRAEIDMSVKILRFEEVAVSGNFTESPSGTCTTFSAPTKGGEGGSVTITDVHGKPRPPVTLVGKNSVTVCPDNGTVTTRD